MLTGLDHLAFIGPGGPEVLVVMLALLLMFGAKDAPRIFRKLNEMLNHFRSTAEHFKREVLYSDLDHNPNSDRAAGDYDDYGVGSREVCEDHDDDLDDDLDGGEPGEIHSSGADAESDAMKDAIEGEGADVQKP